MTWGPPEISKLPVWQEYNFWDAWSKFPSNSQQWHDNIVHNIHCRYGQLIYGTPLTSVKELSLSKHRNKCWYSHPKLGKLYGFPACIHDSALLHFTLEWNHQVHKQFWKEIAGEDTAIKWLGIFRLSVTLWSMLLLPASVVATGTFVIKS